jgi:hypothetical protein
VLSFIFTRSNFEQNLIAAVQTEIKTSLSDSSDGKVINREKHNAFKVHGQNGTARCEEERHFTGKAIA